MRAEYVGDVSGKFTGEAHLYRVPDRSGYVVVSSINIHPFANETMVFESDEDGNVLDWLELGVAYPSGRFEAALKNAGYEEIVLDAKEV